jgi:hypothetical protein
MVGILLTTTGNIEGADDGNAVGIWEGDMVGGSDGLNGGTVGATVGE